ncbi:hypothetical protein Sps_05156 [Shewanella psychrophila]|uniref:Uncharacterized protein n=1 Tax=Shewanella psychrophila TaxID=225848 RepID=A0A1S6HXD9_9GAMM|nr:hypothetical protein [Shewanella psychrophila]AQS40225.1 hypothetical protein Sps_05156 [Shewanella psychrophila]
MNSFQQLKHYHDQLRSEVNITPFLQWHDARIAVWQQEVIDSPQHAASFRKLIKATREAKLRMIEKHNELKHQVSLQRKQGA